MADTEKQVYVIDQGGNMLEGMTKSQIVNAITEYSQTGEITGGAYVEEIKEQNTGKSVTLWFGTQAQYEALPDKDPTSVLYHITDESTLKELDDALTHLIEQLTDGSFIVKNSYNAENVTEKINDIPISEIFESDGKTAKKATIATADESGNNLVQTYAKKTQVVRVDEAQSLTVEEKTRAKDNVVVTTRKEYSTSLSTGWYRVAKLNRQTVYSVTIGQTYNYYPPTNIKLALNLGYQEAVITQESGIASDVVTIDRIRVCVGTTADAFFDVHIPNATFNTTKISIDRLYSDSNAVAIETYENWEYIGTSDTVTGYNVTLLDIVSGTNTSGQVYQQGKPVLTYLGNISPNDAPIPNKIKAFYIPNGAEGAPSSGAGWAISGGSNGSYGAQLAGYDDDKLYYRTMRGRGWESWQSVFKTDPSKLMPSTANGWTETTATGSLPSAGVYLVEVSVPYDFELTRTGVVLIPYDGNSGTCPIAFLTNDHGILTVSATADSSGRHFWLSGLSQSGTTYNQITKIRYKRIA